MSKYKRLFLTLFKRLFRKTAFIILLILIPTISISISITENIEQSGTNVGIFFEDNFGEKILDELNKKTTLINFVEYSNKEQLINDVKAEKVDTGFIVEEKIEEKLFNGKYLDTINVYASSASALKNIAKEHISSTIFQYYSESKYESYIKKNFKEDEIQFAIDAYEEHLTDSSTFTFTYDGELNDNNETELQINKLNIKAILALLIFIGGLNALLISIEDKEEKRFITFCENWKVISANIILQVSTLSMISFISLLLTQNIQNIGSEIINLLMYTIIVCCYCFILSFIFKSKESVSMLIPIIILLSVICCPIFIDLSKYFEIFNMLNKLFPISYYL